MAEETASTETTAAATTETASTTAATTETTTTSVVPETYTLKLPTDATLDATVLERTVAFARERKLSNEQAQAVLDQLNTEAATLKGALLPAYLPGGAEWQKLQTAELTKAVDGWKAETAADVSLGKTPEDRAAALQRGAVVLDKFEEANPEMGKALKAALSTSGIAERREIAHFLSWIGTAAAESRIVTGTTEGGERSEQERLYQMYPSMKPAA